MYSGSGWRAASKINSTRSESQHLLVQLSAASATSASDAMEEATTDHCRQLQCLADLFFQAVDPRRQQRLEVVWHCQAIQIDSLSHLPTAVVCPHQHLAVHQGAHQLFDEEGVAVSLVDDDPAQQLWQR